MLDNRITRTASKQLGFGLIELMVAVALGLLITAAVTAMAVSSLKMNADTLKSARLNQDLGAVMQIMVNDIRRAGYAGDVGSFSDGEDVNIVSSSCILYSYNRDDDSTIDDNEKNGFKLVGNTIKMRTSCTGSNCMTNTGCPLGTWVDMLESDVIKITGFTLNTEGSKCHNLDEAISVQVKPGASATKFACVETTKASLQQWGADGDGNPGWVGLENSITLPLKAFNDTDPIYSIGVRHVNISLEAELTKDSSVSKNLDVSINVRNDHVYKHED